MHELPGRDDLISPPRFYGSNAGRGVTTAQNADRTEQTQQDRQGTNRRRSQLETAELASEVAPEANWCASCVSSEVDYRLNAGPHKWSPAIPEEEERVN